MTYVPCIKDIVKVHVACGLDDNLDLFDNYEKVTENDLRSIVVNTLDTVQAHFYLVPKSKVAEAGGLIEREVPTDAVEDSISAFWNNVSN